MKGDMSIFCYQYRFIVFLLNAEYLSARVEASLRQNERRGKWRWEGLGMLGALHLEMLVLYDGNQSISNTRKRKRATR